MGVKKLEINVFKEEPLYKPGEIVSGEAVLELENKTKIIEVKLEFKGKSTVLTRISRKECRTQNHFYSELRFDADGILIDNCLGASVSPRHKILQRGIHVYPFQIQLPINIPSSCDYESANVTYSILCVVRCSYGNRKISYLKLTVNDNCDLNLYFESIEPVVATDTKKLKWLCCHRGQIECTIYLEQGGYVPGEIIRVKTLINNESSIHITSCQVLLCQKILIKEVHTTHTITKNYPTASYGTITGGRSVVWSAVIHVPQLPASNNSGIILTQYFVVIRINPSSFDAYTVKCPVMIGTKPLRNSNATQAIEQRITHHISTTSLQSTVGAANLFLPQYTAATTSLHDIVGAAQLSPPPYTATTTSLHGIVRAAQLSPPPYTEAVHAQIQQIH